jgi:putative DNA primase/helicase
MIALVRGADGTPANIHRTFLTPEGAKADINRAMMPGEVPEGSAVRLAPVAPVMGIAEGIETALAASARFAMPVWSAINSVGLAKWRPPAGVERVIVFGDNDPKYGGQAAAYALAHKIATRDKLAVEVQIPNIVGRDWADET